MTRAFFDIFGNSEHASHLTKHQLQILQNCVAAGQEHGSRDLHSMLAIIDSTAARALKSDDKEALVLLQTGNMQANFLLGVCDAMLSCKASVAVSMALTLGGENYEAALEDAGKDLESTIEVLIHSLLSQPVPDDLVKVKEATGASADEVGAKLRKIQRQVASRFNVKLRTPTLNTTLN